jgi:hypothetical protein
MFDVSGRIRLEFAEGSVLHGSTVMLRKDLPIREFLKIQRASAGLREVTDETDAEEESLVELYRVFGDAVLLEWDLADGETPIPATGEGMVAIPMRAANSILNGWNAATAVSPNSNAVSESGDSAAAQSPGNS